MFANLVLYLVGERESIISAICKLLDYLFRWNKGF